MYNIGVSTENTLLFENTKRIFSAISKKYNTQFNIEKTDTSNLKTFDSVILFSDKSFDNLGLSARVTHILGDSDYIVVSSINDDFQKGYNMGKAGREAYDTIRFCELEIERVGRIAYEIAEHNGNKILNVDSSYYMESGKLWRKVTHDINEDYPFVNVEDLDGKNIDNIFSYDSSVILTSKLFGEMCENILKRHCKIPIISSSMISEMGYGVYFVNDELSLVLAISDMLKNSFELYEISDKLKENLFSLKSQFSLDEFIKSL